MLMSKNSQQNSLKITSIEENGMSRMKDPGRSTVLQDRGRQAEKKFIKNTEEKISIQERWSDNKSTVQKEKKVKLKTERKSKFSVQEKFEESSNSGSEFDENENGLNANGQNRCTFQLKDSDILYQLDDDNPNPPSYENSQDEDDSNEICSDIQLHYEEYLSNEIERILIEIYNSHINANKKKMINISKYEKHFMYLSQALSSQSSVIIIQILIGKIKHCITDLKTQIFDIPEVKVLRDYLVLRKNSHGGYVHQSLLKNRIDTANGILISKCNALSVSPNKNCSCFSNDTSSSLYDNNNNNSSIHSMGTHAIHYSPLKQEDSLSMNEDCQFINVTKILSEVCNIKHALIKSATDIQKVFQFPLACLENQGKLKNVNIEGIQREEFVRVFLEDEFISGFISQVKISSKAFINEELNELLSQVEEDKLCKKKEITRIAKFLENLPPCTERIKFKFECKTHLVQAPKMEDKTQLSNDTSKPSTHTYQLTPTSASSGASIPLKQKPTNPSEDIDELVKFIISDESKPKKSKKKNKNNKKKKTIDTENLMVMNTNTNTKNCGVPEYDQEVELFKKSIEEYSFKADSIQKIKPKLSPEWIKNIVVMTIAMK